jgi:hypothetical protein
VRGERLEIAEGAAGTGWWPKRTLEEAMTREIIEAL